MKLFIVIFLSLLLPLTVSATNFKDITPVELEKMAKEGSCFKMVFIFASWCPVCGKSFEDFKKLQSEYGKPGIAGFVALSLDQSPEQLDAFVDKFKPVFPVYRLVYSDGKEALASFTRLGINYNGRVPHATIRDCDGTIFADGSFQYPYYNTVLQYRRDNYLE